VETKYIVQVNSLLTEAHRSQIGVTPFKWCLQLDRCLDICTPLLLELLQRWDLGEESFHIWKYLLSLFAFDVCISLGLDVVRQEVECHVYGCGCISSLFSGERITIKGITKMNSSMTGCEEHAVDSVCHLYILLAI